jgi:hypothetical protein
VSADLAVGHMAATGFGNRSSIERAPRVRIPTRSAPRESRADRQRHCQAERRRTSSVDSNRIRAKVLAKLEATQGTRPTRATTRRDSMFIERLQQGMPLLADRPPGLLPPTPVSRKPVRRCESIDCPARRFGPMLRAWRRHEVRTPILCRRDRRDARLREQ